jgi:hypothetical protein
VTLILKAKKTASGIKVVTEGVLDTAVQTSIVPRARIGTFVVDILLDSVYLKGEKIVLNDKIVFDKFDADVNYKEFVDLINNVK